MADVAEKFRAVSGDRSSRQIGFIVKNATDESDAIDATEAYLITHYGNYRDGIPLSEVSVEELAYHKGLFETTATFEVTKPEDPETSDINVSFDVNLDSRRIYRSYKTVQKRAPAGKTAPEHNQKIGVNEDKSVDGVDVRVPVGGFGVTWFAPQASITASYRKTVLDMVGKVNDDTFYGFNAGEVLFSGVQGRARNADDWELTFRFETRPNQTGLTVGEGAYEITGIDVDGWEVMWAYYLTEKNPAGDDDISYPAGVYVERVYELADFSDLGIGTS